MSTSPAHERLVARLIADPTPVHPLWPPQVRLALWLILQALILGLAVAGSLRQNLGDHLRQPLFVIELGGLFVSGVVAAVVALRAAVPGMMSRRLATMSLLLAGIGAVLVSLEPASTMRSVSGFVASGAQCLVCILGFSAVPGIALFVAVRRGAPVDPAVAGACAGAAALLFGAAAVRIACPIDEQIHLLSWHTMPIAAGAALSAVAGAKWLDRWHRHDRGL